MNARDDISLAQWSLIDEYRTGKLRTLDFPRTARQDFGLNGIELVNTLLEVPTEAYLRQLKSNADYHGINIVLLMVDDEGDGCSATKEGRKEFVTFHRKWVDIAQYLGCHAIRTNCRGTPMVDRSDALDWAAETYHALLEYAKPAGIKVLIENHGGVSNDADWMVSFMKIVDDPFLGAYPDWRQSGPDFDNVAYLEKVLPYAKGMSYRNQPTDELTNRMLGLCQQYGFHGWFGIESGGREQIRKGIRLIRTFHQENAAIT